MKTTSTYTLGLDFGTLSVRALIVDTRDGRAVAETADRMAAEVERVYRPDPIAVQVYGEMFVKYKELYEYFGKR